jgi:ATP-dependent DNA helicase RecG
MLAVVDAGGQAVLLAPTEVLAHQHARSIAALLGPLALAGQLGGDDRATAIALLTGSLGAASRQAALDNISTGAAGIVVGTHALLERGVEFHDLGLVVVDEQHRFGVEQRDVLRTKASKPPHVLVMTATPIPRTVAMTIFGDLETSALTELPKGRAPIATTVVPVHDKPGWVDRIWERVHEEVGKGHQAYVVCPRIGTDQGLTEEEVAAEPADRISSVTETVAELRDGPLKDLRVDVMHGRLPAEVKDDVMRRFSAGGLDVLVSTTVIEVGVDVPNATVMVIMDADRFGVSQLHQLRGRVGRGDAPGLCLLVTETPPGHPARERLDAVAGTLDGFALAELDLEQRREGDILGAAQSGRRSSLRLLEVLRDVEVIQHAREAAFDLVEADPHLRNHPGLAGAVAAFVDEQRAEYLEKA